MKKLKKLLKWIEDSTAKDLNFVSEEIYDYGQDILNEDGEDSEPELLSLLEWIENKVDDGEEPEADEIYKYGSEILKRETHGN